MHTNKSLNESRRSRMYKKSIKEGVILRPINESRGVPIKNSPQYVKSLRRNNEK